jgi:hypothetical protein
MYQDQYVAQLLSKDFPHACDIEGCYLLKKGFLE